MRTITSVLIVFLFLLSGCASFRILDFPLSEPHFPELPVELDYLDYTGIVHVHSRYSYDSKGRFHEIVRAARGANADFVMVTDHDTLQGLHERMNGFHGNVLILIGAELSTREGHLLVLGIEEVPNRDQPVHDLLKEIEEAQGMSFVAHGESKRTPWKDWSAAPLTGMEVYSLSSDIYQDEVIPVGFKLFFLPPRLFFKSLLDHPGRYLDRWDDLLRSGAVVAIGSVDAHQRFRFLGRPLDHYDTVFKVVQTHAWAANLSTRGILEAFRRGHLYIGFDLIAPVRNFLFWAERKGRTVIMGDEMVYSEEIQLKVFVPKRGQIHLLKDGELLAKNKGTSLEIQPPGPGIYRVEVYRGRRLWILSNPIYLLH